MTSSALLTLAHAELHFFFASPETIIPRCYSLFVFNSLESSQVCLANMPACKQLLSSPSLELLISQYPILLTRFNTQAHSWQGDYDRLVEPDAQILENVDTYIQTPWLELNMNFHRPLCTLMALVLSTRKHATGNGNTIAIQPLHPHSILCIWDSIFKNNLPEHQAAISHLRRVLFPLKA
jgi:hypothetical protein